MTFLRGALATALLATAAAAEDPRAYAPLRFDENWRFLDEDGTRGGDLFDVVKARDLGGPWRLTFGGSTRLRYETGEDTKLGTSPTDGDDLGRLRQSLHLDISRGGAFRWFAEIAHADTMGSEWMASGRDENDVDVQNMFWDFTAVPTTPHSVTFRVGRQEMSFGRERLVGVDDFANVRTTFDGLRIIARTRRTETSLFGTRPVERFEEHELDEPSRDLAFGGVYTRFMPRTNHAIEGYALGLWDDTLHVSEETGEYGDARTWTIGCRYEWTHGGWTVETEAAYQTGHASDDDVRAGFATAGAAYRWGKAPWQPQIDFGVEVATGDDSPSDGRRGTFSPLFGSTRTGLGHLGVTGRRNIECARIGVTTTPMRGMTWETSVLVSQLEESRDGLYDELGTTLRKDPTGTSGRGIGWEAHSQVSYEFHRHHEVSLEVAHFRGGEVVDTLGDHSDASWGWVGYEFKF